MSDVVLTVLGAWLVLAALATAACALVARGGQEEDRQRLHLDGAPPLEDAGAALPRPRVPLG